MNEALIIVDVQRGFMPANGQPGFGELPVPGGQEIIRSINRLAASGLITATTQDWHPARTAHFAANGAEPDFTISWPPHCVAGTPGAELHPDLELPAGTVSFHKGMEVLRRGEDDTSYSGFNALGATSGDRLPDWLQKRGITKLLVVGLALDHCVRATALDFQRAGYQVAVATDASRPVSIKSGRRTISEFSAAGIAVTTTADWLQNGN